MYVDIVISNIFHLNKHFFFLFLFFSVLSILPATFFSAGSHKDPRKYFYFCKGVVRSMRPVTFFKQVRRETIESVELLQKYI